MKPKTAADYDSPWKEAIEVYFKAFMELISPKIACEIEWSKGYEFLDKDLEKVVRDAKTGRRYVDKLVKVYLNDGKETWLLIHIEVQGYADQAFTMRMYVYNYRLFDRYGVEVISLAVMTDDDPAYKPCQYKRERFGCKINFVFPFVKILNFRKKWKSLECSINPFSIVLMAHLKAQELKTGKDEERKYWKLYITHKLYERGYTRKDILELFRFIDWLLILPQGLDKLFWEELKETEEENKMTYVTSVERYGFEQGSLWDAREMLLEVLKSRFKKVPEHIENTLNQIEEHDLLRSLIRYAATCDNLDSFEKKMQKQRRKIK